MNPEQLLALLGIVATVLGLLVKVWFEIRSVHHLVNSRMTELLELTRQAARAQGVLDADTSKIALERHPGQRAPLND